MCLRSALRRDPELRCGLKHCCHCGIFFLTHPSNVKRNDLGCPFGCRKAHRKRESSRRSAEYYRTPEGRIKKRALNRRRYEVHAADADTIPDPVDCAESDRDDSESIIDYVCMVTGLIERRAVSREEVKNMLLTISRQHSLWQRGRFDYLVEQLNKDPP